MRLFNLIFLFMAHCLTHISVFSEADELAVDTIPSYPEHANTEGNGPGAGQQQGDWTDTQNKLNQQFGANLMPGPVLLDEETAKRLSESEKDKVDDAVHKEIDTANVDNPAVQVPVQETVQINENVKPVSNIDVPNNPVVLQGQVENGVPIVPIGTVNNPGDTAAYLNLPAAVNPVDTYAPKDLLASNIETVNNNDNNVNAQQTQLGNQMISQQSFENPVAGNPGLPQSALQNNLEDTTVHEMNNQQPQSQGAVEYHQKNLFQPPQKPEQNIINEQQPQIQSQMAAQQDIGMNNNLINAPQSQGQGIPQMNDPNNAGTNPLLNDNVEGNRIYDQQPKINAEGAAVQGNVANIPSPILPANGAIPAQQNQQVVPAAGVPQGSNDNNTNTLQSENGESKTSEKIQPVPLVPASGFGVENVGGEQTELDVNKVEETPAANKNLQILGGNSPDQSVVGVPSNQIPAQDAAGSPDSQIPGQLAPSQDFVKTTAQTDQGAESQAAINHVMPNHDNGEANVPQDTIGNPEMQEAVQAMPNQGAPIGTGVQMPVQGVVPHETVGSPAIKETVQAVPGQGAIDGIQMPSQETVGSPDKHEPVQAMPDQGTGVQMPVQGGVPQGDTNESAAPVEFKTTTPLSSTEATTKWDTTKLDRYLNNTDNADAGRQDTDYDYKGDDHDDANFDEFDNGNDMDNDDLDDGFYGDDDADADDDDLFDDMDADANDENLDAWKNWQAKDDNDSNDFGDQDTDRWPERASTEQSSTASVETDRFGVDGVEYEEAARFKQPFMDDESYARKMASHNMGFDDQLYGNEPTISIYSWILFFLLLFLTLSFFAYWSRHRVFAYIRQAQGRRSSGSLQYRREESKSLLKHEIA